MQRGKKTIYEEGVYSGRRAAKGGGAACVSDGRGSAGRYVQVRGRPWVCVRWEAALTAEHARLEWMVLRARRGTHQGSVDTEDTPAGMQRKGDGLEIRGMRAVGSFCSGRSAGQWATGGRGRKNRAGRGELSGEDWRPAARVRRGWRARSRRLPARRGDCSAL
jgi:hypothetical protein